MIFFITKMKYTVLTLLGAFNLVKEGKCAIRTSGKATTTRYWDCSGGACGCGFGNKD
jgi:hypothetical protein